MNNNDILIKVKEFFIEKNFEAIIDLITSNNAYTNELMLFLAVAYSLKEDSDFVQSNNILLNYFEDGLPNPLYHFTLAYNFFSMKKYGMALEHFRLTKLLDPDFMTVDSYILECKNFLKYPIGESFIRKKNRFWAKFKEIKILLYTIEDFQEFLEYLFDLIFPDIYAVIDCVNNKNVKTVYFHSFEDRTDAIKIYFLLKDAPVFDGFHFILGVVDDEKIYHKLRKRIGNEIVEINAKNLYASYHEVDGKIGFTVFLEDSIENKTALLEYIREYLEIYFGSSFTIMYLSYIHIAHNKKGLRPIYLIKKELLSLYKTVSLNEYLFKKEPFKQEFISSEVLKLRDDIYSGYTMVPELINEYNIGFDIGVMDRLERGGIVCGFIYYDNDTVDYHDKESFRLAIEDKIKEEFSINGKVIGGYMGSEHSYIDIMAFDLDYCIDKLREIADVMNIGEVCFSVYRQDIDTLSLTSHTFNPIVYSREDDEKILEHIEKTIGEIKRVIPDDPSDDIRVDINIVYPTEKRNYYTLITHGVGAKSMNIPQKYRELNIDRAELMLTLPPDWNMDSREERWFWPILFLRNLARASFKEDTWLAPGHTIYIENIIKNSKLSGFILSTPILYGIESTICRISNGKDLNFYSLIPAYHEEMNYTAKYKLDGLLKLFKNEKMSIEDIFIFNDKRRNSLIDKTLN